MNDFGMRALLNMFIVMTVFCVLFVPLGMWKAWELLSWVLENVKIVW